MIVTFALTTILMLLAALCFAIKKIVTGKEATLCKRCGDPEKDHCTICNKRDGR